MHHSSTRPWLLSNESERKGGEKQKQEDTEGNGLMLKEKEEKKRYINIEIKSRERKATNRSVWKKGWRRTERRKK